MITPYFDDLLPLRVDEGNFMVYKLLNADQRIAFGNIGIQFMARIHGFSKAKAFHLVFKLVEYYEKRVPREANQKAKVEIAGIQAKTG